MANNDIIRHDDIAEKNVTKPLIDDVLLVIDVLKSLENELTDVSKKIKVTFEKGNASTVEEINRLNEALKQSNEAYKQKEKILKEVRAQKEKVRQETGKTIEEITKERVEQQRANQERRENAKLMSEQFGAYDKMSIRLNKLRRDYKNLVAEGKADTEMLKQKKREIDQLDSTLKRIDASVGQHQRNVGNYASGFQGLRNSINQLTREAPAFANSINTGFMAISNNLPIFIDEITRLKAANAELNAEGKKTPSIWKTVGASFFSLQTLFSAGITLLTLYGGELVKAIGGMFGYKDAADEAAKSQKKFNEQVKSSLESLSASEQTNIEALELQRDTYKRLAEQRGASAKELYDIDVEYNEKIIAEIEHYTKERETMLQNENDRELEIRRNYEDEVLETQLLESEKRQRQIANEIDEANALRKKYLTNNRTANIQRSLKELEDQKKLSEARMKQMKDDLELQHKINVDSINGIEDELDRKILLLQEENEYKKLLNDIEISDKKKRNEANLALDERYYREAADLQEEAINKSIDARIKEQEELDKLNQKEFDDLFNELERQRDLEVEEEEKKRKEQLKAQEQFYKNSIGLLEQNSKQRSSIQQQEINDEIDRSRRREDMLKELAIKGSKDASESIALEQKRQAELEEKRIKELKRQQRNELIFSGLKAYAANVNSNPGTALSKTLKDITTLSAALRALPAFEKGTEDTGEHGYGVDGKGGFLATLHPNERVLTKEQNKKIGQLTNDELSDLAFMYQKGAMPELIMSKHVDDRHIKKLDAVKEGIDNLTKVLENKPVSTFQYDEVGKMLVNITKTKHKTNITKQKIRGF